MNNSLKVNHGKLLKRIVLYFVIVLICVFILYPYLYNIICHPIQSQKRPPPKGKTLFAKYFLRK